MCIRDRYGTEQSGSLIQRMDSLEDDVYGTITSDAILARVDNMYDYLEGTPDNGEASFATRLNVVEWRLNESMSGGPAKSRIEAAEKLLHHSDGILNAATAFGKTIVCSYLIAKRKVNTLILIESASLMEQWENALIKFLDVQEELPTYQTKTGRIRVRKSLIGTLQGAHNSMTGIIDIAMAGSLCKKGEWNPLLQEYGMVIVDECHHAASDLSLIHISEPTRPY